MRITLILFLFILVSCDPCKDVECEFGTCVEGLCECDEFFHGESCSSQVRPASITIVRVEYANLSPDKFGFVRWDSKDGTDSLPDVFLEIRKSISTQPWYSSDIEENSFQRSFRFEVNQKTTDIYDHFDFILFEDDPNGRGQMLFLKAWSLYSGYHGYPVELSFVYPDGSEFRLFLEYEF